MLDKYELEQQIKAMGDRDLLEFLARQQWETNCRCTAHEKLIGKHEERIGKLETSDRRMTLIGSALAFATTIIVNALSWLLKRP